MSFVYLLNDPEFTNPFQTDGFSDNVFPADMLSICSWTLSHGQRTNASEDEQVQTMADNMVLFARDCMGDTAKVSPFEGEF